MKTSGLQWLPEPSHVLQNPAIAPGFRVIGRAIENDFPYFIVEYLKPFTHLGYSKFLSGEDP